MALNKIWDFYIWKLKSVKKTQTFCKICGSHSVLGGL